MADTSILKYDIRAMLRKFGVVTVMDVKAYETKLFQVDQEEDKTAGDYKAAYSAGEWDAKNTFYKVVTKIPEGGGEPTEEIVAVKPVFTLDTLKIANINQEGPTKTITGGQNADTLLKYGKTVTVEMQDALGHYDVLKSIYGVNFSDNHQIASFTDRFPKELTLVGTTFVIDQQTGAKQPIHIVIPRFLGDGIFNLQQDSEGDATVFDLNGNLLKFEGGSVSDSAVSTGEERFKDTHDTYDGYIYGEGADNEFYFMCTKDILPVIQNVGYREAFMAEDVTYDDTAKKYTVTIKTEE